MRRLLFLGAAAAAMTHLRGMDGGASVLTLDDASLETEPGTVDALEDAELVTTTTTVSAEASQPMNRHQRRKAAALARRKP